MCKRALKFPTKLVVEQRRIRSRKIRSLGIQYRDSQVGLCLCHCEEDMAFLYNARSFCWANSFPLSLHFHTSYEVRSTLYQFDISTDYIIITWCTCCHRSGITIFSACITPARVDMPIQILARQSRSTRLALYPTALYSYQTLCTF
jgi:hypothetical protein